MPDKKNNEVSVAKIFSVLFSADNGLLETFGLTEREADIMSKRFSEDQPVFKIAAQFNLSINTIDRIIQQASDKLKQGLKHAIEARQCIISLREENKLLKEENELLKARFESMTPKEQKKIGSVELLRSSVDVLHLDVRTRNVLNDQGIKTVAQLVKLNDQQFREMRNMGVKSIIRLKDALEMAGLELASQD